MIFGKLWQFDPGERTEVRIDSGKSAFSVAPGRPGTEVMPLFKDEREEVRLERWAPEAKVAPDALPTLGKMLADQIAGVDAEKADARLENANKNKLWAEPTS